MCETKEFDVTKLSYLLVTTVIRFYLWNFDAVLVWVWKCSAVSVFIHLVLSHWQISQSMYLVSLIRVCVYMHSSFYQEHWLLWSLWSVLHTIAMEITSSLFNCYSLVHLMMALASCNHSITNCLLHFLWSSQSCHQIIAVFSPKDKLLQFRPTTIPLPTKRMIIDRLTC